MPGMLKATAIGHIGRDPEFSNTPSGVALCKFSVATPSRNRKDDDGNKETNWIDVICWRKTAEFVSEWGSKGRLVCVEGHMELRKYTAKDGTPRIAVEIVAEEVLFLDRKDGNGNGEHHTADPAPAAPADDDDPFADE